MKTRIAKKVLLDYIERWLTHLNPKSLALAPRRGLDANDRISLLKEVVKAFYEYSKFKVSNLKLFLHSSISSICSPTLAQFEHAWLTANALFRFHSGSFLTYDYLPLPYFI